MLNMHRDIFHLCMQVFAAQHPARVAPRDAVLFTAFVACLVPRALATGDSMYFIDVGWNSVLGLSQLAVLTRYAGVCDAPVAVS